MVHAGPFGRFIRPVTVVIGDGCPSLARSGLLGADHLKFLAVAREVALTLVHAVAGDTDRPNVEEVPSAKAVLSRNSMRPSPHDLSRSCDSAGRVT